ncbi:hypothetical protein [Methanopyrus sp.]
MNQGPAVLRCWQRPPVCVPKPHRLALRNITTIHDPRGLISGTISRVLNGAESGARGWIYGKKSMGWSERSAELELAALNSSTFGVGRLKTEEPGARWEHWIVFQSPVGNVKIDGEKLPAEEPLTVKSIKVDCDSKLMKISFEDDAGTLMKLKSDDDYSWELKKCSANVRFNISPKVENGEVECIYKICAEEGDFSLKTVDNIIEYLQNKEVFSCERIWEKPEKVKSKSRVSKYIEILVEVELSDFVDKVSKVDVDYRLDREKKFKVVDVELLVTLNQDEVKKELLKRLYGVSGNIDFADEILFLTFAPHARFEVSTN